MTPEDLTGLMKLAHAESGTAPTIEMAAVWFEALGEWPTEDVRAEVLRWSATHRWPPKASEIREQLLGSDRHSLAVASDSMKRMVSSGRLHPSCPAPLTREEFPDDASWLAHRELGRRIWYDHTAEAATKLYEAAYSRFKAFPPSEAPTLTAGPERHLRALPDVTRSVSDD